MTGKGKAPTTLTQTETAVLEKIYIDVVAFERKVRLSFGAEFNALLSQRQLDVFLSKFDKLIEEDSTDAKLAYPRLHSRPTVKSDVVVSLFSWSVFRVVSFLLAIPIGHVRAPCHPRSLPALTGSLGSP